MAFVRSHGKLVARCIGLFVLLGGCISSAVVLGVKRDALPAMLRWVHEHRVGGMFIYGLIYICEFVVVVVCVWLWRAGRGAAEECRRVKARRAPSSVRITCAHSTNAPPPLLLLLLLVCVTHTHTHLSHHHHHQHHAAATLRVKKQYHRVHW
jgi:hypothetical protein